jgi:tRNA G18 (ribose-2'-O)-methylase SpoU
MEEHIGVPAMGRPGAVVQVDDPGDPRLADYRRLNDPAGRRALEAERSIIVVEGRLAVARLLESEHRVLSLLVDDRHLVAVDHLVVSTLDRGAPVYVGTPEVVAATVGFALHRGVVAVARRPVSVAAGDLLADIAPSSGVGEPPAVVAVLEGLNDHENIGALFRNAAAFGVSAVLMDPTCADPLYRRSIRVSVGHVLRVPFARLPTWPAGLDLLRDAGFLVAAMAAVPPDGVGSGPHPLRLSELRARVSRGTGPTHDDRGGDRLGRPGGVALLLGAEGPGLSDRARSTADVTVSIPMSHGVDSLNVATAAAVAFHALREDS